MCVCVMQLLMQLGADEMDGWYEWIKSMDGFVLRGICA